MMTSKERMARIDSVYCMRETAFDKHLALYKEARKLDAFITLFEPPEVLKNAIRARAKRVYAESENAWHLYCVFSDVEDTLYARPYVLNIGNGNTSDMAGFLPNGKETSTNEAEALQMIADYFKERDAKPAEEGAPF